MCPHLNLSSPPALLPGPTAEAAAAAALTVRARLPPIPANARPGPTAAVTLTLRAAPAHPQSLWGDMDFGEWGYIYILLLRIYCIQYFPQHCLFSQYYNKVY